MLFRESSPHEPDSVWVVPVEPRGMSLFITILTDFLTREDRLLAKTGGGVQRGKIKEI